MIYLKGTYQTILTPREIGAWVQSQNAKPKGIFNVKKYRTETDDNGFTLRMISHDPDDNFRPKATGKWTKSGKTTRLSLSIGPQLSGLVFYAAFLIGFPVAILLSDDKFFENTFNFPMADKAITLILVFAMMTPIIYFGMVRHMFKLRSILIKELKLEKMETLKY